MKEQHEGQISLALGPCSGWVGAHSPAFESSASGEGAEPGGCQGPSWIWLSGCSGLHGVEGGVPSWSHPEEEEEQLVTHPEACEQVFLFRHRKSWTTHTHRCTQTQIHFIV